MIESIFGSKSCFLEEPRWQRALRSTVIDCDDYQERSLAFVQLNALSARIPNAFQTVTRIVHTKLGVKTSCISKSLDKLHTDFRVWAKEWRDLLELTCRNESIDNVTRHHALMQLLHYYMLSIIVCRLRITICPVSSMKIEDEAVSSCIGILSLRRALMRCQPYGRSNDSIYTQVGAATHATTPAWKYAIQNTSSDRVVDIETFDDWCRLIGRSSGHSKGDTAYDTNST